MKYIGFIELLLFSVLTSAFFLFVYSLVKGDLISSFKISVKDYLSSAIMGFLNPFFYYFILFKAYALLPAQVAQSLNYSWAIVLTIFSAILLKKKITLKDLTGMLISFCGFLLVVGIFGKSEEEYLSTFGILLAIGSSIFWALFWILNLKDKREAHLKLLHSFLFGCIYLFIFILVSGIKPNVSAAGIMSSLYIGIFEMSLTFLIWLKALECSESTAKTANIVFLSPFVSLLLINVILKEAIMWNTIAGLTLIIAGIVFQRIRKPIKKK